MDKIKGVLNNKNFIYALIALFSLLLACLSKNYDYDLYARLIVGEHFFKTGWITYQDFLSYTPTHLWYDHEWGSSVVFYAFFKAFGNFGLILVQAITMFFTTFFIIKTQKLQKHAYPTSLIFILFFLILFSHQNPSIVRCHMFSFMFFSMLLYFLEKTRLQNSNLIWLMLPITIIWNNLHGGIVSGLGIIFLYFIGELLTRRPWKKYLGVLILSTPLLCINPYGIDYLQFLISANTKNRYYVTEWWTVFAQRHVIYYYPLFLTSVFTVFIALFNAISKKKFNLTKILILVVTTTLGIIHVKLLSLPLIVLSALFYNEIISLINKKSLRFLNKLACVLMIISIVLIPYTKPTLARTDATKFPVLEVEFLKINKIEGNLLTLFGLGSYVSYKLYPQNLIYMDGRYEEVYYDEEFNNLVHYEKVDFPNWDNVLKNYPTRILMPQINSHIYNFLKKNQDWIEIYKGLLCGIFVSKNDLLSNKKFITPPLDKNYYISREFENFGKFGEVKE